MLEILFIFGAFGWLLGAACEYLSSLDAFPTILVAFLLVPLLACTDYLEMLNRLELGGIHQRRQPVPPERFYWLIHQGRLLRALGWLTPLAAASWTVAIRWPASLAVNGASAAGWLAGVAAVLSTARLTSTCAVYVRASRWFDKMAPWAIGVCRRTLYRLSDNPDFLAPENPERREEEKSIY